MNETPLRVVVAGLGNMGRSHALAYHRNPGFQIAALVNRSDVALGPELAGYGIRSSFSDVLAEERPDVASINTYSDSHADYAVEALEAGCHVFVEKPLATTVADARRVVDAARANGRKLVIGYILRHHPSWIRLIAEARALGGPYVFRMNLNQQSAGAHWETHKQLMKTTSPLVDCGVHYLDVMCQITDAKPKQVRGMGLRLTNEISPDMYNYGHLQVPKYCYRHQQRCRQDYPHLFIINYHTPTAFIPPSLTSFSILTHLLTYPYTPPFISVIAHHYQARTVFLKKISLMLLSPIFDELCSRAPPLSWARESLKMMAVRQQELLLSWD